MRYLDIKIIEKKLQEDTDKYTVIVVYIDGEKYQITDILKKHMDAPTFADAIKKMAIKKFPNKQFKTFYVVGENGEKIDGYDFEVLKTDKLDPDGVPDKKTDKEKDQGEIKKPSDDTDDSDDADNLELDTTPIQDKSKTVKPDPDAEKIEPEDDISTVSIVDPNELAARKYSAKQNRTVDKNQDGIHDETGEVLPLIYADGTLRDPKNPEKVVGTVPGYNDTTFWDGDEKQDDAGSGKDGDEGLTGEQSGSAPEIADQLFQAMDGIGTDEGLMFSALDRIETKAHWNEVSKLYTKKYDANFMDDIEGEFEYDLRDNQSMVDELNDITKKIGYVLLGNRMFGTIGFGYVWKNVEKIKIKGTYVGFARPGGWHMGVTLEVDGKRYGVSPDKSEGYFGTKYGSSYVMGPVQTKAVGPEQVLLTMPVNNSFSKVASSWLSKELDNYIYDNVPNNGKIEPVKVGDPLTITHLKQATVIGKANGLSNSEMADIFDDFPGGRDEMIGQPLDQDWVDMINNYKGSKK